MKSVLTIAGSDSSGGAGIQADIKTITMHNVFATCAITALTAQNTCGVFGISKVEPSFLIKQIECVANDIFPDAVKIGMLADSDLVEAVAESIKRFSLKNIVLDPVMVSTSGSDLLKEKAVSSMITKLFLLADVITPNIPEAEVLAQFKIDSKQKMEEAAKLIAELSENNSAVMIKGGHFKEMASDYLYYKENGAYTGCWIEAERLDNPNTHGTGCTLSSAIASNLANGLSVKDSVINAKNYVYKAIEWGLDIGKGRGPLNHMYKLG